MSVCQSISYVLYKTDELDFFSRLCGMFYGEIAHMKPIVISAKAPLTSESIDSSVDIASQGAAKATAVTSSGSISQIGAQSFSPTFSPLYQQIKSLITQSLQSGDWKPGELIPSEVELAARYKVSQGTVRKAIDELSAENVVVRRQGRGTFVATHHEAQSQFRFLRLMPDEGTPCHPENKIIEVKRMRAPADVARLLEMKSGDSTVFIRRVQSFAGVPTIVDDLWLPGIIFKGLTAERLNEYKGPMYGLFETEFGTHMIRATEQIRAVCADDDIAALLNIERGLPLLKVERVSFTYGDKPVELRSGQYLTSAYHYKNELN
jgi:GntR family transcriptional regulator